MDKKTLLRELGLQTLISIGIFGALFLLLALVEHLNPAIHLLQWDSLAFIIGIPASVIGTAYVLTIKNPINYMGFYAGVVMSVLLSIQFFLNGQYDQVILYLAIFTPFQIKSLINWRQNLIHPKDDDGDFAPAFLDRKGLLLSIGIALGLIAIDYVIATYSGHTGWGENIVIKIVGGIVFAASFLANYWMIYKKNDAWLYWVIYSVAGIIFFSILPQPNLFLIVLNIVFLLVNGSAQIAWLKMTQAEDYGWFASPEQARSLLRIFMDIQLRRDGRRELSLKRQEQMLEQQLKLNRVRQAELLTQKLKIEIKYGHIVDVVNRCIFDGEIQIQDGKILKISKAIVPENAPYYMPGFIDSHIHIESTLLLPEYYAQLAVEQGTIGVITDPHEIANVLGVDGVDYMINSGKKVRFHFHFAAPSCVPATPFETSGAHIDSKAVEQLLRRDEVYGLGEMMNVPGVLNGDKETIAKINATLAAGKIVDGHAPGLTGEDLDTYIESGISTDHECTRLAEAEERVKKGMVVQIREGSAACDFEALAPVIAEDAEHVMFCSDDKYPDELTHGYMNELCRRAINRDIPLWDVLTAACVTPIKLYGLNHGLLQEGDAADFITVDNLREFNVQDVYIDGVQVCADGIHTRQLTVDDTPVDTNYPNHFLAESISVEDIRVKAQKGKLKVIGTTEGSLLTTKMLVEPKIADGLVVSDTEQDVLKLVCLSRHSKAKPVVGFIHGFGLKQGAMASTIGHDSHNIIALGVRDEDIVKAINAVIDMKGGLVINDGHEITELALPIAGLISYRDGYKVAKRHAQLKTVAARIGCKYRAPFMTMAFMSLSVIPELKLTDKGLFDGVKFDFTSLFE